jgi:hypothetical protein
MYDIVLKRLVRFDIAPFNLSYLEEALECYPFPDGYSLRGKTVIDVGCDFGTTPIFWRANGASKVIGYEANGSAVSRLGALRRRAPWFEFRGLWKGEYPEGDVFKMDCEGCEAALDPEKLSKYELWFVALHPQTFGMELKGREVHQHEGEKVVRGGRLDVA